ncbi:MAG: glutamate--tRNA ligase, partial [Rhodobacter sp.]|nr:glutamate--tRNA ligase [Rhodobacter sp.]
FPLTRAHNQSLSYDAMAGHIRALGVPDDLAGQFWAVARDNITVKADLAQWWTLFSEGAEPLIDPEDGEFVAKAMALLPPRPWTAETWGQWTTAVGDATGRKGKALFRPLRRALTGRDAGPEMADVMPLLQKLRAPG